MKMAKRKTSWTGKVISFAIVLYSATVIWIAYRAGGLQLALDNAITMTACIAVGFLAGYYVRDCRS